MEELRRVKNQFMARPVVPLPNSLSNRQLCHKIIDTLLVAASGVGITVMLALLFMIN